MLGAWIIKNVQPVFRLATCLLRPRKKGGEPHSFHFRSFIGLADIQLPCSNAAVDTGALQLSMLLASYYVKISLSSLLHTVGFGHRWPATRAFNLHTPRYDSRTAQPNKIHFEFRWNQTRKTKNPESNAKEKRWNNYAEFHIPFRSTRIQILGSPLWFIIMWFRLTSFAVLLSTFIFV